MISRPSSAPLAPFLSLDHVHQKEKITLEHIYFIKLYSRTETGRRESGEGVSGRRRVRASGKVGCGKRERDEKYLAASSSGLLDALSRGNLEVGLASRSGGDRGRAHAASAEEQRLKGVSGQIRTRMHPRSDKRSRETRDETDRSLICFAMVKKACSTLVASLADVSRNGIDSESAYSCTGTRIASKEQSVTLRLHPYFSAEWS